MQTVEDRNATHQLRLKQLMRLRETGWTSERFDRAIDRLFTIEIGEEQKTIDRLRPDLIRFEARYRLRSADFLARFEQGELGDTEDYTEWASLYRMYLRAVRRYVLLTQ